MTIENSFITTNQQYNRGIAIDEYNGKISLVEANEGNDGKIYSKWGFPQGKNGTPTAKAIPWKIEIGEDRADAIETLQTMIDSLQNGEQLNTDNQPPGESDEIPF